jgi:hypothetical protein
MVEIWLVVRVVGYWGTILGRLMLTVGKQSRARFNLQKIVRESAFGSRIFLRLCLGASIHRARTLQGLDDG